MGVSGFTFKANPSQVLYLDSNDNGMKEDPVLTESMNRIVKTEGDEARAEWEKLQYLWTDLLPVTKIGGYSHLYALGEHVNGFVYSHGAQFWNVSVD